MASVPQQLFGPWPIRQAEIFFSTRLAFATVNLKPIVPGHVMVIPKRVVPRFADLTQDEVSELFLAAHTVSKVIEKEYGGESMTITMQDGPMAGQTVPHVHVHIIPRRKGDWANNDDIYPEIDRKEKELGHAITLENEKQQQQPKPRVDADEERKPRSRDEMAAEAGHLRTLF